jgi:hypothetical protein
MGREGVEWVREGEWARGGGDEGKGGVRDEWERGYVG